MPDHLFHPPSGKSLRNQDTEKHGTQHWPFDLLGVHGFSSSRALLSFQKTRSLESNKPKRFKVSCQSVGEIDRKYSTRRGCLDSFLTVQNVEGSCTSQDRFPLKNWNGSALLFLGPGNNVRGFTSRFTHGKQGHCGPGSRSNLRRVPKIPKGDQ